MNSQTRKCDDAKIRRRYLLHLSTALEAGVSVHQYVARIQPWTSRRRALNEQHERFFVDEAALVEAVNPLLPCGSDVRDVLGHIESIDGFFYLLRLSPDEARQLGWIRGAVE